MDAVKIEKNTDSCVIHQIFDLGTRELSGFSATKCIQFVFYYEIYIVAFWLVKSLNEIK